jgi:hypothetical protein
VPCLSCTDMVQPDQLCVRIPPPLDVSSRATPVAWIRAAPRSGRSVPSMSATVSPSFRLKYYIGIETSTGSNRTIQGPLIPYYCGGLEVHAERTRKLFVMHDGMRTPRALCGRGPRYGRAGI